MSLLLLACAVSLALADRPWMDTGKQMSHPNPSSAGLTPSQRAAALLGQMNLTEKIDMLHGWDGPYVGNVIPNTRLGIPALNLNDGPQVRLRCLLCTLDPSRASETMLVLAQPLNGRRD